MKKIFTLFTIGLITVGASYGQWCVPSATSTTMNTYLPSSPVITNVTFNTINRTTVSSNKELYINTGIGTTVARGASVPFSMTYTLDVPICPQMHIRVWIDWNLDGDFTDAGETTVTVSNTAATTYSGSITIPSNATLGTTRMRVALKMIEVCGHIAPDPCVPTESAGWHGEIEDYDLTITTAVGINETSSVVGIKIYPNPSKGIFNLDVPAGFDANQITVYSITGSEVYKTDKFLPTIDLSTLDKGIYFIKIENNSTTLIERLVIK